MTLRLLLRNEIRSISSLRRASPLPSAFCDYSEQVYRLTEYISALDLRTKNPQELDISLAAYGVDLFDDNPRRGNLQKFRYSLFGKIFFLPQLKPVLNRARQTKKGWDKLVPSRSSPPLLAPVGKIRASSAINLGFHASLRANEIYSLKIADI